MIRSKIHRATVTASDLDYVGSGTVDPDRLLHWESENAIRADSPTGLRYRHHVRMGRSILLFARESAQDRPPPFWFLGPATYVSHVGERPMDVTWRLHTPLPGDLFAAFAAAVA